MNSLKKISELKAGDFFYNSEIDMVCMVYDECTEDCSSLWYIGSDGVTHLVDSSFDVCNIKVEPIVDFEVAYTKYPHFDKDIKLTMLSYKASHCHVVDLIKEQHRIEEEVRKSKKYLAGLESYLVQKAEIYDNIDLMESDLCKEREKLNTSFQSVCE